VLATHIHIVGAERRGDVDDAGAVFHAHEVAVQHVRVVPLDRQELVERLVVHPQQIFALHLLDDRVGFRMLERFVHQGLAQDQALGAAIVRGPLDHHVIQAAAHRQRGVAGQRPGRGGPGQEVGAGLVLHGKAHEHARIGHLFVTQRDLVTAQRRATAGAVGHHFVALVEQVLVPELAQDPPDALDVLVGVGDISVVEVHPERDALGQALPLLDVAEDTLAALLVVLRDAVFLDLPLVREAKLFLDLDLDR